MGIFYFERIVNKQGVDEGSRYLTADPFLIPDLVRDPGKNLEKVVGYHTFRITQNRVLLIDGFHVKGFVSGWSKLGYFFLLSCLTRDEKTLSPFSIRPLTTFSSTS